MKTRIDVSAIDDDPKPKRGWTVWVENGSWFTAPKVSSKLFGPHDYAIGGRALGEVRGIGRCKCGCHMDRFSSGGDVDPFGCCPQNPRPKNQRRSDSAEKTRK